MNDLKLVILTHPPLRLKNIDYYLRVALKIICFSLVGRRDKVMGVFVGGHSSVTLSLLSGLKKLNTQFYLNNYQQVYKADLVIVLSGVTVLEAILMEKKRGLVTKVWAGPNISVLPNEANSLLCDKNIDALLVPSRWIADKYCKINEELRKKIFIWPAGTNLDLYPIESIKSKRSNILIYHKYKQPNELILSMLDQISMCSAKRGIDIENIFYGSYTTNDYVDKLSRSFLCFYLSDRPESQGLALQESWAMNVPTAVLRQDQFSYSGFTASASSAPYISSRTGIIFDKPKDIDFIVEFFNSAKNTNSSRAWIEYFLTDTISAQNLINYYYEN